MRRLSTLSPKTTSTSGDDVNVNVNAQYNVNHLTVTPQLQLHLHLHYLGIQFYLTAPQLPSSPYMSPTHGPDARDERSRRRPEAARDRRTASDTNGFRACRFGLQPLSVVTSSVLYFYFYIILRARVRGSLRSPGCSVPRAGSLPSPMVDVDDASPSGSESQASHTACVGPCHRTPAPPGRAAALVVHCSSASVKRAPKRSRARSWLQVPNQEGT